MILTIVTLTDKYVPEICGALVSSGYTISAGFDDGRMYLKNNAVCLISIKLKKNAKLTSKIDTLDCLVEIQSFLKKLKIYYYSIFVIDGDHAADLGTIDGEEDCVSRGFKLKALL